MSETPTASAAQRTPPLQGVPTDEPAQERLEDFLGSLPTIIYVEAGEGPSRFSFMSPGIESALGYPTHRFVREEGFYLTLVHDADRPLLGSRSVSPAGTEPFAADYRLMTVDGSYRWFHDDAAYIAERAGTPAHRRGVLFDITARRASEIEAGELKARYRALVEQLPAATYIDRIDDDLTSIYVSPHVEEVIGIPADRFAREHLWESCIHPDDRAAAVEGTYRGVASGSGFTLEYRMIRPDGGIVWVRDQASTVRDADGGPLFVQGIYTDITEQKALEQELREAAARFQTLAERIPAVAYLEQLEDQASPSYISPRYQDLVGYSPQERLATPDLWEQILHPDDHDAAIAAIEGIDHTTHDAWSLEYRLIHRDGHAVWVRDDGSLVCDDGGVPLFWLGLLTDITSQKEAEQELRTALDLERRSAQQLREIDDIKSTFLTAVSHDLRTPLTAILGSALTLRQGDELGLSTTERNELLDSLVRRTRRLTSLVTDLLDVDRLGRGVMEPRRKLTDVGAFAQDILAELDLPEGRAVRIATPSSFATVDTSMVARILENLLANAAKHTPVGAVIWVRTWTEEGGIVLAVEDDGPGIDPAIAERIFEPFERGPSPNPQSPGVGIGLSLVARFAELHGGRAWVQEREGGGASFQVWFPQRPLPPDETAGR